MTTIVTRVGNGAPLTTQQLDANFTNLNTDKLEKSGESASFADLTLSTVSATLHRSPNAITAMFIYDVAKTDSDGGAWTEKCAHTSWWNEPLNGKWLGAQATESAARAVSGAATGDYFQLTTDGKFYKLNAGSGTAEVFRGNKKSFPKVAAIVAEAANVTIYDLTEPGRPMWMRFVANGGESMAIYSTASSVVALNGTLLIGDSTYDLYRVNFPLDKGDRFGSTNVSARFKGNISVRNTASGFYTTDPSLGYLPSRAINAVAMTVLPDAPLDPVTGLKEPTIGIATAGGISIIQNTGIVRNSSLTSAFTQITITPQLLSAGLAGTTWYYAQNPGALGASFALSSDTNTAAPDFNDGNTTVLKAKDRSALARSSGAVVQMLRNNEATVGKGIAAKLSNTFNAGTLLGDIRRCFLADTATGSVTGTIQDRSYKAATGTVTGTLTAAAVASNASLVAYSGFSAANYAREPYSADLDFGTGEWSVGAWVNVPTGNAAAATIACREHSSGPYIRLGIDSTNKLTATAYDGTTTRTVTTAAAYNTGVWTKVRATYTTDGTLSLMVNGVNVASTTGAPLLTLNNSNAVLTIGNSYALDAPFPGSISLLKFSATVPTTQEQALWMYEQEKQLFRDGAQCVLPSSGNVLDLSYDDETDTWSALQATHESTWSGLVRTSTQTPSAGSFAKAAATSGIKLLSRTTTNPGVDIQMPARNLRAELRRRREAMNANQDIVVFDYFGGFTATTTLNSTALTSVAASLYPSATNLIGCAISGTGIPAGTVITGISGTTIYMSKAATANGSAIQISTTDFNLPVGYTARAVMTAGTLQKEGATSSWVRLFDGFKETIRFNVAPEYSAWVQIQGVRENA